MESSLSAPSITDELVLRDCEAGDIPEITAIYRHAVLTGSASFEIEPPSESEMTRRRELLITGNFPYVVAIVADELAGYAYAGAYRPRPAYANTVESSVYVSENFHGRGIGKALMTRVIREAEARGFRQMLAVIGDSNNRASIRLHESLGFRIVGMLQSVGWKHGRWLDTVLVQKALGRGDTASPSRAGR
ncbi:GCN5 family acetyltransferase [Paramesorhizobium deserti]|uniref:GCN5 family acetyltransferase n=1 Tax=Paramesorhizobium deserti TaxID=1494590 RepID=A0A135HTV4_9HYPH|nr:GCN5 family acetyltransferase [Paramesorhizobium deserti]